MQEPNITSMVQNTLWEDLKNIGDLTADSLIDINKMGTGRIFTKDDGVIAGTDFIMETFTNRCEQL